MRALRTLMFLTSMVANPFIANATKETLNIEITWTGWAVAAVPRLVTRLSPPGEFPLGQRVWGARSGLLLPEGAPDRWRNVFTGEELRVPPGRGKKTLPLHAVFGHLPVALLANVKG